MLMYDAIHLAFILCSNNPHGQQQDAGEFLTDVMASMCDLPSLAKRLAIIMFSPAAYYVVVVIALSHNFQTNVISS